MVQIADEVRTGRRRGVDALRGAAIVLMVLDHLLVQTDPAHGLRYTLTRLSLPLFAGCAAVVFRGRLGRGRAWVLAALVVVETALNPPLSLGAPGPAALIGMCLLVFSVPAARGLAPVVAVLGLLQHMYWPGPWSGYQPGLVLAWFVLGAQAVERLERPAERLDRRMSGWLSSVGRRPAAWYAGHLAVLVLVAEGGLL